MASTNSEPGVWRGTTAEQRAEPRREKLVQAAFELVGDHGAAGTTVRGVCAGAGLNPRYFYESFGELDALLVTVFDRVMSETTTAALAAIAAAPDTAEAKTRAALEAAIRHVAEDPRRVRIVFGETALAQRRAESVSLVATLMADQAAGFFGIARDDTLLVSTTFMIAGGISELVLAWQAGRVDVSLDELIEHAVALTLAAARAPRR